MSMEAAMTAQACEGEARKGFHCWHRATLYAPGCDHEEVVETCCWCGSRVRYRGPNLRPGLHGPHFRRRGVPSPIGEKVETR